MIKLTCECGEVYHSDRQHIGRHILCKKCLNTIEVQENVPTLSENPTRQVAEPSPAKKCTVRSINCSNIFRKYFKVGIIVTIVIVGVIYFAVMLTSRQNASQPSSPIQQTTVPGNRYVVEEQPDTATEPTNPRRIPLGSSPFGKGIRSGKSTLTIDNGTSNDAFVRVIRINPTRQTARSFFIPNAQKFTANQIPPGDYILKVAFGRDWDTGKNRFNFQRSFGESESFDITESAWDEDTYDGIIKHTRASRMSITLHKVAYGNFKSHDISEEEFWQ